MINFLSSSVGKKVIMSLTGFFLMVFITLHACLNLTALYSRELYDAACEFMGSNIAIQLMVPILALGFVVHILFSLWIECSNLASRPRTMKYAVPQKTKTQWSARNMFVLGVIVLGFLCLHLINFWSKMQLQHFLGNEEANAYELLIHLFSKWYFCVLYIVWVGALFFHLTHGFWSAFQSLGANNSTWLPRLQSLARIYSVVIFFAYVSIPVCVKLFLQGN